MEGKNETVDADPPPSSPAQVPSVSSALVAETKTESADENVDEASASVKGEDEMDSESNEQASTEVTDTLPLSKNQQKKMAKLARALERKKLKRVEERNRKKERRKRAREEGEPIVTRKQLRLQGAMERSACRQRVAIDCGLDAYMRESDVKKTYQQLGYCYAANRRAPAPLQLYFTDFASRTAQAQKCPGGIRSVRKLLAALEMYEEMKKKSGGGDWDVHLRPENLLAVFPPEEIVYLTAESYTTLDTLDVNKVYVIGGLVDHNAHKGLCHRLATERGLATARLPIDSFLEMKTRKVLTINHVFEILLHFSQTQDWAAALLKVIPQRKEAAPKSAKPEEDESSRETKGLLGEDSAEKIDPSVVPRSTESKEQSGADNESAEDTVHISSELSKCLVQSSEPTLSGEDVTTDPSDP